MNTNLSGSPFFSIIIPCYNAMDYIDGIFLSFEKQSFKDFEIILIDDCSTDKTYDYCLQKCDESRLNVRIYKNNSNIGPGKTRDRGLRLAAGQFVGFCDSDDWFEENALDIIYKKISESASTDLIFFNYFRFFPNGQKRIVYNVYNFSKCLKKEDFVALSPDSFWSLFAKRELFAKIPMNELYNAEDLATVPIIITEAKNISWLNEPLYNYRYRSSSLSTTVSREVVENFWSAFLFIKSNAHDQFKLAFEFLYIKIIIYGWVHNAVRCKFNYSDLKQKIDIFEQEFPNWYDNKYIKYFPFRKRIWTKCVKYRLFLLLHLYVNFQTLYFKTFTKN